MRSILVTGGAGFIGSHLVDALLAAGNSVTVLDNFDHFYPREIKERNLDSARQHSQCRVVEQDLRDLDGMRQALGGGFDVIVHLAAKAGVRPSIADPVTYQDVNVRGTQNLLELARVWGTPQFVFASSSSVYGVNPRVPWSEDDHVLQPISPYASTKVSGELLGHVYSHLYGIRFVALRFFTVYGPRQRPDLAITKFARLMLDGQPIPVFGDGSTRRDYTFVGDTVSGIIGAINYTASSYEIINLGNNQTVTLQEMIAGLERALGVSARIEQLPEQPGDVPQTWATVDKARRLLGYEPRTSYSEGVARFAEWLRASAPGAATAAAGRRSATSSRTARSGQVQQGDTMTMERTAWLFTKDEESVRLDVRQTPAGVELVIEGPGATVNSFDFPAGTAVEGFRRDYEQKLLADGYRLQVVSERRSDESPREQRSERRRRRR
jgi:UDP-glucuronate 4-epimerase